MLALCAFLSWYLACLQQAVLVFRPAERTDPSLGYRGREVVITVGEDFCNVGVAHLCAFQPSLPDDIVQAE